MTEKEIFHEFPAHRLEGALRFSAHEVRVGTEAPDFALPDLSAKQSGCPLIAVSPMWF